MPIRIIKHELAELQSGSFEVRFPDRRKSHYFYFDDHPGRRAITRRGDRATAEEQAKAAARALRDSTQTEPTIK